jgi:hypothetical protein
MSAASVIHQSGALHLLTDGAHYDYNGTVAAILSKVWEVAGCAIATRGVGGHWPIWLCRLLDGAGQYGRPPFPLKGLDDLLDALPAVARCVHAEIVSRREPGAPADFPPDIELTIGGWSERRARLECWGLANRPANPANPCDIPAGFDGYEPFRPVPMPAVAVQPGIKSITAALGRPVHSIADLDAIDVDQAALSIIEEQRRTPYELHGLSDLYAVGGFAELTTVTREGVARRILRVWPDSVGSKIEP